MLAKEFRFCNIYFLFGTKYSKIEQLEFAEDSL